MLSPFRDAASFVIKRNTDVSASIAGLLSSRCPLHVVGLIPFVIINAFKCVLRGRTWPDVSVKHLERFPPFSANSNSSLDIVFGAFGFRIEASLSHAKPYVVLRAVRQSMLVVYFGGSFPSQTPARSSLTVAQVTGLGNSRCAAFTKTCPKGRLANFMMKFYRSESAKFIEWLYNQSSQDVNLRRQVSFWLGSLAASNSARADFIITRWLI